MSATARASEVRIPLAEAPGRGERRMVEVGGRRNGLFRVGDELHALADRCPHRGAPLCSGSVATSIDVRDGELVLGTPNGTLRCPWHKWEFDIASGRALADDRLRVRRYAVSVHGAEVVVSLDAPPDRTV
jgi:3-phenylpropionate/trans-cinnamate dioxygenase ferredoxin subunit